MRTSISITSMKSADLSDPRDLRPFATLPDKGFVIFGLAEVEVTVDHDDLRSVGTALSELAEKLIRLAMTEPPKVEDEEPAAEVLEPPPGE